MVYVLNVAAKILQYQRRKTVNKELKPEGIKDIKSNYQTQPNVKLASINSEESDKELFCLAVERVLVNINPRIYEQVQNRLSKNYGCNVGDCLENPEYLKKILSELFGNVSIFLIESIKNTLQESRDKKSLTSFLVRK